MFTGRETSVFLSSLLRSFPGRFGCARAAPSAASMCALVFGGALQASKVIQFCNPKRLDAQPTHDNSIIGNDWQNICLTSRTVGNTCWNRPHISYSKTCVTCSFPSLGPRPPSLAFRRRERDGDIYWIAAMTMMMIFPFRRSRATSAGAHGRGWCTLDMNPWCRNNNSSSS